MDDTLKSLGNQQFSLGKPAAYRVSIWEVEAADAS